MRPRERMRSRGRERRRRGLESRRSGSARVWCSGGGRTSVVGRSPVSVLQSVLPGATPSASAERPTPPVSVFSVCDPRRLRVWIYQKVTLPIVSGSAASLQPVSSKSRECLFWPPLKNSLRRMRGLQSGCTAGSVPAAELFAGRYPTKLYFAHFAHKSDPYSWPPQCKDRARAPADTDLHMYGRRRARALLLIFMLFHYSAGGLGALGTGPYSAFAIKSGARRLRGALIDNAPRAVKSFFRAPRRRNASCRRVFLSIVVSFKASTQQRHTRACVSI
jgi:hypothetical protein